MDECIQAFHEEIGEPTGNFDIPRTSRFDITLTNFTHEDWTEFHMYPKAFRVVTRTANRLLFGKQLCRNAEFLQLAIDYSDTFFMGANIIRHYPSFLKPIIVRLKTGITAQQRVAKKHLRPLINERLKAEKEARQNGTYDEFEKNKPSDCGRDQ